MGLVFYLDKNSKSLNTLISDGIQIESKTILSTQEADEFIDLQTKAKNAIKEDISNLSKDGLIFESPYRSSNMLFVLAKNSLGVVIGYGYGYKDAHYKETYYIDTVFIDQGFQGKKISIAIINTFVNYCLGLDNIKFIKGVTQPENVKAINLLISNGFKKVMKQIKIKMEYLEGFTVPQISVECPDETDPITKSISEHLNSEPYLKDLLEQGRIYVTKDDGKVKELIYEFN